MKEQEITAWAFPSVEKAVENAVFLAGYQNDVDRVIMTTTLYSNGRWSTGTTVIENGKTIHTFGVTLAGYEDLRFFSIETAPLSGESFLWLVDNQITLVDEPMESSEDWPHRNEGSYFTNTAGAHVGDPDELPN